jgi:hypothetical protein
MFCVRLNERKRSLYINAVRRRIAPLFFLPTFTKKKKEQMATHTVLRSQKLVNEIFYFQRLSGTSLFKRFARRYNLLILNTTPLSCKAIYTPINCPVRNCG